MKQEMQLQAMNWNQPRLLPIGHAIKMVHARRSHLSFNPIYWIWWIVFSLLRVFGLGLGAMKEETTMIESAKRRLKGRRRNCIYRPKRNQELGYVIDELKSILDDLRKEKDTDSLC